MTRDEFLENCICMDDIARICSEYDYYDLIEDYRDEDTIEDWIDDCFLRSIEDLANFQSTLESYRWFYIGDYTIDGVEDSGEDFNRLKANLFRLLVEDGYIDDEEDENEDTVDNGIFENNSGTRFVYEEEPEEEVDGFAVEEEISIFEAVEEGSHIQTISTEECDETEEISILF